MILISSGLICEDEQDFSKARNNRAKDSLVAASRHKSWSGFEMNGRPSLGTQGQYSALHYRTWTLSLLHYCDDYNAVKHIWKYKLETLFERETKRIQCQWGSFRLCQIRNFLVSSFRTKVSRGVYGLNRLRSKAQCAISVVQLIVSVWITRQSCKSVTL